MRLTPLLACALLAACPPITQAATPWRGIAADDYRQSYAVCRLSGVAKVARAYHARERTELGAATAYVRGWTRYRQPTFEGCLDGLLHRHPRLIGTWP